MYQHELMTQMRLQYLSIKSQKQDTLLLFRFGDYYEAFDDDARIIAKVCDLVLTNKKIAFDVHIPMVGVPYHRIDDHVKALVAAGYTVAVAEQMLSDTLPKQAAVTSVTTQMELLGGVTA